MAGTISRLHSKAEWVETIRDDFDVPVADFFLFQPERLFYVRWHGHLTSDEVIRVSQASLPWLKRTRPLGLLNDKRDVSGDWGDAMAWLEYEWVPQALAAGLRVFAYVISAETQVSFPNAQVITMIRHRLELRTFFSVGVAWKWLRTRTSPAE